MKSIAAIALLVAALLGWGHSSEQSDRVLTLDELTTLVEKDAPNRFGEIVRFIENAPSEVEAASGLELFNRASDVLSDRQQAICKQIGDIETGPERDRIDREIEALFKPLMPYVEVIQLSKEDATSVLFSLGKAKPAERVALIRKLSGEAGSDFEMKDDEVYFGPRCGTYDHSHEIKLLLAAKRFRSESVQALLQSKWQGRRQLMIALSWATTGPLEPSLHDGLIALAEDANVLVRGEALLLLSRSPGTDTERAVANGLQNRAADTRAKALIAAADLKLTRLEPMATSLLGDKVSSVREGVIGYLSAIATPSAKSKLCDMLSGDQDQLWYVFRAISRAKCTEAIPYLHRMFSDSRTAENRSSALKCLADLDLPGHTDLVIASLHDKDKNVIYQAMDTILEHHIQEARSELERLLGHSDEYVRDAAQMTLGRLQKT